MVASEALLQLWVSWASAELGALFGSIKARQHREFRHVSSWWPPWSPRQEKIGRQMAACTMRFQYFNFKVRPRCYFPVR